MSTEAEGAQVPHPDSPAARAETDAEQEARWQAEAEQARADSIDLARESARRHLSDAAKALRFADHAVARLREADLYDVEFEGAEATYDTARVQVDVGLAACNYALPSPEQ